MGKRTLSIKFIARIKPEHNPPEFEKGMGEGVVYTVIVDYLPTSKQDVSVALDINRQKEELLSDFFEIVAEDVTVKEKKEG